MSGSKKQPLSKPQLLDLMRRQHVAALTGFTDAQLTDLGGFDADQEAEK